MRARRAIRADRRRPPLRRADRGAPWAVEPGRPGEDRAGRRGSRRPLRVPPRLPRGRARPGLRLRALGAAAPRVELSDRLRARGHRGRAPGERRAAVLVLLRLQRLEQPPRGRLGGDPALVRRARTRARRSARSPSRSATPARGLGDGRLARREAGARRRPATGRLPRRGLHANFYESALYLGSSGEQGVGCDDTRGPHVELEPTVVTIPSDPAEAPPSSPLDHLRGTAGESSRTPSSTVPRGQTSSGSGAVRSARPRNGGRAATPCPPAAFSAPVRPTSSAARSPPARAA